MAQSLASPPEEGKRKPPAQRGLVKNKCGLGQETHPKKMGLFPVSKEYLAISGISKKICKTNFPNKKNSTPFPKKKKLFIKVSHPPPPPFEQKKHGFYKMWTCFTGGAPLRSPGANSESSAANLARTGTKPQPVDVMGSWESKLMHCIFSDLLHLLVGGGFDPSEKY